MQVLELLERVAYSLGAPVEKLRIIFPPRVIRYGKVK
jgi:hypothetical protein